MAHKDENPDPRAWTEFKLDWIDRYCFYRPYATLTDVFGREYDLRHREIDYCRFRAAPTGVVGRAVRFAPLKGAVERTFRRVAFMAIKLDRRG